MSITGLSLPALSEYDPPVAGEGSLDPMGLGAISDRLADRLVPGLRARMQRVRFVTAMAVGATVYEPLADELAVDDVSTPAICFEWIVLEALVRRLPPGDMPVGVAGAQKARAVVRLNQRLSAATYLKGPAVFGFHGVYKPFAVDSGLVTDALEPGWSCADLTRVWELEQGLSGFTDAVAGSNGGRLLARLREQVRNALRDGRCTTNPGSGLYGHIAASLHPSRPGSRERVALRGFLSDDTRSTRAELAGLVAKVEGELTEAEVLEIVRPHCSSELGEIVDAVVAYERFAMLVDAAFRTLCSVSYSMGTQPMMARDVVGHGTIDLCSREVGGRYREAMEKMGAIGAEAGLESRLGEFAIRRSPTELFLLILEHHEGVQAAKSLGGKRPWFEPHRKGWVVRSPYGTAEPPVPDARFVHPVRVSALRRFLTDTAT
jgi:hypothetical protein